MSVVGSAGCLGAPIAIFSSSHNFRDFPGDPVAKTTLPVQGAQVPT